MAHRLPGVAAAMGIGYTVGFDITDEV